LTRQGLVGRGVVVGWLKSGTVAEYVATTGLALHITGPSQSGGKLLTFKLCAGWDHQLDHPGGCIIPVDC